MPLELIFYLAYCPRELLGASRSRQATGTKHLGCVLGKDKRVNRQYRKE